MKKDMNPYEAYLKETCRELFNLAVKAEVEMTPACETCTRSKARIEIDYKARMALQIITGIDEEDAIELVEEISYQETKSYLVSKNTKEAKNFLENSFNQELSEDE